MINTVSEMQQLLFQIHSMSKLLFCHHAELIDSEKLRYEDGDISEPILSIAEIIKEKAEACLEKAVLLEEHLFREADTAAETKPGIVQ